MAVLVVTAPAPIVSLDEAKAHLRVTGDDEDGLIEGYVAAASAHIDGPDGILGRAVMEQTLALVGPAPGRRLRLFGPVSAVEEVSWIDSLGATQIVAPDHYTLDGGWLVLRSGLAWPFAGTTNPVRVVFMAGEASAPTPIRQAVLLIVGQWFRNRMAVNVGNIVNEMPNGVAALLAPYKHWRV